jgi:hypothetical protein
VLPIVSLSDPCAERPNLSRARVISLYAYLASDGVGIRPVKEARNKTIFGSLGPKKYPCSVSIQNIGTGTHS